MKNEQKCGKTVKIEKFTAPKNKQKVWKCGKSINFEIFKPAEMMEKCENHGNPAKMIKIMHKIDEF